MTLPHGFGMGNRSRCTQCGEYKSSKNICITKYCKSNTSGKVLIPFSTYTIGKVLFYIAFFGGIILILTSTSHDDVGTGVGLLVLGIFLVPLSTLWVGFKYEYGGDRSWRKRKQLFFWAVPIVAGLKKIEFRKLSFKDES